MTFNLTLSAADLLLLLPEIFLTIWLCVILALDFSQLPAEIMIIVGSWEKYPFQVVVAMLGIVLTMAYLFKMMRGLFYGKLDPEYAHAADAKNWVDRMPLLLLIACSIILGIFPGHFYDVVRSTVEPMIDRINQVAPLVTQNTQGLFP